jgi:hypothetical protein
MRESSRSASAVWSATRSSAGRPSGRAPPVVQRPPSRAEHRAPPDGAAAGEQGEGGRLVERGPDQVGVGVEEERRVGAGQQRVGHDPVREQAAEVGAGLPLRAEHLAGSARDPDRGALERLFGERPHCLSGEQGRRDDAGRRRGQHGEHRQRQGGQRPHQLRPS